MKKIRHSVFETNSSSTHSISFGQGPYTPDKFYIHGNVLEIYDGEFGWEIEEYYDCASKASYAYTYCVMDGSMHNLNMLESVIQSEIGEDIAINFVDEGGYIDHQSWEIGEDIFQSRDTLHRFIFDGNTVLRTDNDNH